MTPLLLAAAMFLQTADTSALYQVELVRAAPGDLPAVTALYQRRSDIHVAAGEPRPVIMRHRQGDHWDLLVLTPMGTFATYFGAERARRLETAGAAAGLTRQAWRTQVTPRIAWREDTFMKGPAVDSVLAALAGGALYHIEMFIALPGKRAELFGEREMENTYLAHLSRPVNLIFTRAGGAAWDAMTIGTYRDLPHFAAGDTIPADREGEAARAAGFASPAGIGVYLRSLLQRHNDTLARPVR